MCKENSYIALKVTGVRPLADHRLWLRFNTDEMKIFDFKPLLTAPAFSPLNEMTLFNTVYLDFGVPVWKDGTIDIAPEYLYEHGVPAEEVPNA